MIETIKKLMNEVKENNMKQIGKKEYEITVNDEQKFIIKTIPVLVMNKIGYLTKANKSLMFFLGQAIDESYNFNFVDLIFDQLEFFLDVINIGTGIDKETLENFDIEDLAIIAIGMINVNISFFRKKIVSPN